MAEACRRALPGTFVAASSEVWPEMREYERAMTTFMCAYVGPVMTSYLSGLGQRLVEVGITCPVEVMESSGGVMSAASASRRPVYTVESGGAAGVIAAGALSRALGAGRVLSFDMGGTTAKAGVVTDGVPGLTHDFQIGGKGSFGGTRPGTGFPVKIPVVDLAEVGAGGGSIAWVDAGGALRVGPRSAGSVPGPACYGIGGTEATVTDANLVLGYLNPDGLAGGRVALTRRGRGRAGPLGGRAPRGRRWPMPPGPCTTSPTRRWRPPSASSPSSVVSIPATSCSSGSAAPDRCTSPGWPRRSGSTPSPSRGPPVWPRRWGSSAPISASTGWPRAITAAEPVERVAGRGRSSPSWRPRAGPSSRWRAPPPSRGRSTPATGARPTRSRSPCSSSRWRATTCPGWWPGSTSTTATRTASSSTRRWSW